MNTRIHVTDLTAWLRGHQWLVQNGYMPKAHAVIGDPPYFLGTSANKGFMGQKWDGFADPNDYQTWVTEWATLLLDFVYPGAVLALFGGTRTYHRLACGLEEAGWEIFDSMLIANGNTVGQSAWTYGSGFPKSYSVGRNLDGDDFNGYGSALKPSYEKIVMAKSPNAPVYEDIPIALARAPRGGRTYAQLAREFGTAALNVDGGRIGNNEPDMLRIRNTTPGHSMFGLDYANNGNQLGRWPANFALVHAPDCGATCAPGCPVAALAEQSGESVSKDGGVAGWQKGGYVGGKYEPIDRTGYNDAGSASRFFYTAKSSAFERAAGLPYGERSSHPTMKPITLVEWLCTILLPPASIGERRLLVLFSGSGSEMIGARLAGWQDITGIEQSAEYAAIAEARLAWWSQFTSYDAAKERYDSEQRGAAEDAALEDAGQLRLFE